MGFLANLPTFSVLSSDYQAEREVIRVAAPSESDNYYGLSIGESHVVTYSGPLNEVSLEASEIPGFLGRLLQRAPATHLLILPRMGLVILIQSNEDFLGLQFLSPMTKADLASSLKAGFIGKKIRILAEYGAFELP
jgi:hypothetical protein